MKKWILILSIISLVTCLLLILSETGRHFLISKGFSPQTKGFRIAHESGCFVCHGQHGGGGIPNPGVKTIPALNNFSFLMSVRDDTELEQWILDGAPSRLANPDPTQRAVRMPAYRHRLSTPQFDALKRYYYYMSGIISPPAGPALQGFEAARRRGCFSCHGYGGMIDQPNPGSLTGYIPAWSSPDYEELVQNTAELHQWIEKGVCDRLATNPIARFFLGRQTLVMPAYQHLLKEGELEQITAYINWLRQPENHTDKRPDFQAGESGFDPFEY